MDPFHYHVMQHQVPAKAAEDRRKLKTVNAIVSAALFTRECAISTAQVRARSLQEQFVIQHAIEDPESGSYGLATEEQFISVHVVECDREECTKRKDFYVV